MNQVAELCINQFLKLPRKCHPNAPNSESKVWTVLAGCVVEYNGEYKCIVLSTGVKCLGKSTIEKGGSEKLIRDCHAEVLMKRGLMLYIYRDLKRVKHGDDGLIFERIQEDEYRLKDVKFHLYISHCPCGDASMSELEKSQGVEERLENEKKRMGYETTDGVIRGRLDYGALGRCRTKPGRLDADDSLSMSCSDKIMKWLNLGVQGCLLYSLIGKVEVESIGIGDYYDEDSVKRAFGGRINQQVCKVYPVEEETQTRWKWRRQNGVKGADTSCCWIKGEDGMDLLEIYVNGKKQNGYGMLNDEEMVKNFVEVGGRLLGKTYKELKRDNIVYQQLRNDFMVKVGDWIDKPWDWTLK